VPSPNPQSSKLGPNLDFRAQISAVALRISELIEVPKFVAIDGMSAAGKSTFARALAERVGESELIRGDDFGRAMSDEARIALSPREGFVRDFDWQRLRAEVLVPLKARKVAGYRRYDWHACRLGDFAEALPSDVVIAEGVYMSRPELRDLFDLVVWIETPQPLRDERQALREGSAAWVEHWHHAESYYVETLHPSETADIVVAGSAPDA